MHASITLKDIRKDYGAVSVIKGIDLDIAPGEFVVLVGPSGCGKSTLLRMIAGLETISGGDLLFNETRVNDWSPAERKVGMVFQSYALYPHMSVADNVGFGLKLAGTGKAELAERVEEALKVLQLDHLRDRKPSELSGGQRQRVAIGRAIVRRPQVFLFDEPLSNLDTALRVDMRMEIGKLHRKLGNTVVYVTHDQVEAMTLADRVVVLEGGHVRQVGSPLELYNHPQNTFVAAFMGSPKMAFIQGVFEGEDKDQLIFSVRSGDDSARFGLAGKGRRCKQGLIYTLGVRPEHCTLIAADAAALSGEILEIERLGSQTFAFIGVDGAQGPVAVLAESGTTLLPGDRAGVHFDPEQVHLFDETGEAIAPAE